LKIKSDASLAGIKTTFQVGTYFDYEGMDPETVGLVVGNPDKRKKLISSMIEISKNYEFDGVTLMWLFPGCPQVEN
jgi:GH18 family chitinase